MTRTQAQRINAKYDKIWATYQAQEAAKADLLPTVTDYSYFLGEAEKRLHITRDDARQQYGKFTYGQWKILLGLA